MTGFLDSPACDASRETAIEGGENPFGVEQAGGLPLPGDQSLRVGGIRFRRGCRGWRRSACWNRWMPPTSSARKTRRFHPSWRPGAGHNFGAPCRLPGLAPPQEAAERDANQQFTANVDQAKHQAPPRCGSE